ncbi:hypothetical protein V502_08508 [Pseudogymnoascus sp. VKM F-4520 (FW-2644)]|nr:hypothetical protein V502_08508 [Pseudogymnoascus sp. VKM F-4520 (FW-2644)]
MESCAASKQPLTLPDLDTPSWLPIFTRRPLQPTRRDSQPGGRSNPDKAAVPPQPGPSGGRAELLTSVRRVTKCKQNITGVSLSRQISRNHGTLNHKVRDYSETMVGDLFDLSSPPPHPASPSKSPSLTPAARPSPNKRVCRRKGDFVSQVVPFLFLASIRPAPQLAAAVRIPIPVAMVSSICSSPAAQQHGNHVASTLALTGCCSSTATACPIAVTALHLHSLGGRRRNVI